MPTPIFSTPDDYVAPTVYLLAAKTAIGKYNYYKSMGDAAQKCLYLNNGTGANSTPLGQVTFINNGQAQTMGINVDFFVFNSGAWVPRTYAQLRGTSLSGMIIFSFYSTQGGGPYWAIFDNRYFGISATTVRGSDPQKALALDNFYRSVQLMKYRYNYLAGFLNQLSQRQLNPAEQQIYNSGLLLMQNLTNQMRSINGITISYTDKGTIGNPVILIIAIIAIVAGATGWTIYAIQMEQEKTQRINDAYDLNKWVADKKVAIAQQVNQGVISQQQANDAIQTLDNASSVANKIALNASKNSEGGFLGDTASIIKWGVIGFLGFKAFEAFNNKKQSA